MGEATTPHAGGLHESIKDDRLQIAAYKVSHEKRGANLQPIRALTGAELEKLKEITAIYTTARDRFQLFRILHRNFEEWEAGLAKCSENKRDPDLEKLELDRLMLNFLTTARALIDHFTQ